MQTKISFLRRKVWQVLHLYLFLFFLNTTLQGQAFCGTLNPEDPGTRSSSDCEYDNDNGVYYLPVVFHNFSSRELSGLDAQDIVSDMAGYFLGHPQKIIPILAKFNTVGECFNGVFDYETIETISDLGSQAVYSKLYTDLFPNNTFQSFRDRYVNVFIFESFQNYNGILAAASDLNSSFKYILISNAETSNFSVLDMGRLIAHELGHYLHLLHPHGDLPGTGCNDDPCTGQDMILDTPVGPNYTDIDDQLCGVQTTYCNNDYNQSNLMTYGGFPSEGCSNQFLTLGQMNRMSLYLNTVHSHLFSNTNLLRTIGLNSSTITSDITYTNQTINNGTFEVLDNVKIHIYGNVSLNNSFYGMGKNTKVIVYDGAKLTLNNTHLSSYCNNSVWHGIEVLPGGQIETKNVSKVDGAKIGVLAHYGATNIRLDNTHFRDCEIGVKLGEIEGSGYIRNFISNCHFLSGNYTGRGPTPPFLKMKIGIAAYECGSLSVYPNNNFEENGLGILSVNNTNFIHTNTMKDCESGVDIDNRLSQKYSYVSNNVIENQFCSALPNCKRPGIKVHGGVVTILSNTLRANIGMELIGIQGDDLSSNLFQLAYNRFKGCEKRAFELKSSRNITLYLNTPISGYDSKEIFLGDDYNVALLDNDFSNENAKVNFFRYGSFNTNLIASLQFSGSNNNNFLYDNVVYGTANITSSPQNTYRCNTIADPTTFKSNNLGTSLTANYFSYEFNITGATTQISPQINRGNDFTGVTANYGASQDFLENNLFVVKNAAPYVPSTVNGPNDWFDPNGDNNQPNCETNPSFDSPWEADQFTKCVDSLFQGTKYTRFSTQQKWSILLTLYRIYKKRGEAFPLDLSPCAVRLLNDYGQHVVGKIDRLYERVDSLKDLRVVGVASDSIRQISQDIVDMMDNEAEPDSIILIMDDIIVHEPGRNAEWAAYDSVYQSWKTEILQTASDIEYETSVEPFLYLAQLVPSLIAYHEGDMAHFDSLKLDFLEEVILACDTIAGEAAYIAAYLYESVTGHDISDYMDCQQNPLPRTIRKHSDVKIYPNPVMDRLTIEGIEGQAQVSFYNLTGQLMKKIVILNGQSFDISDLQQGVYILKVSGAGLQTEQTFKVIKL